jgi:hypothetical protein
MFSARGGRTEVAIDDLDGDLRPAEIQGALLKGVLHVQTLLIADGLIRTRLANIDQGLAAQVTGGDEFGCDHGAPLAKWLRVLG